MRCSFLLLCAPLVLVGAETTVEDFAPVAGRTPVVFQDAEHGSATIEIVTAPAGEPGQAAVVTWSDWRKPYLDFITGVPRAVTDFSDGQSGIMHARLYLPAGTALNGVAIRFTDTGGETFQWPAAGDLGSPGWRTVVFSIDPTTSSGHWGGDANGKIDPPLRFQGFAIVPQAVAPSAGTIAIGAVTSNATSAGH